MLEVEDVIVLLLNQAHLKETNKQKPQKGITFKYWSASYEQSVRAGFSEIAGTTVTTQPAVSKKPQAVQD